MKIEEADLQLHFRSISNLLKPFHFKKFSVLQDEKVFRVGTDAVLLGSLATVNNFKFILEIGTGTGIISLMLAQKNQDAKITAIDIDENAAILSGLNFKNSIYAHRIFAIKADFNQFKSEHKFDLIICNPPYFEMTPQSHKDEVARQKIYLNFSQLIINAAHHLDENGIFSVIIPFDFTDDFESEALQNSLFLSRKIIIFGREGLKAKRVILEFKKEKTLATVSEFIIEKSPRKFSDQYLEITKDFHIFK